VEFFRNCFSEITERLNDADTSDLATLESLADEDGKTALDFQWSSLLF
jgi:hypothetical protein